MLFFLCLCTFFSSFFGGTNTHENPIPPRFQWNENNGYCGEVSLISAGLYYGQYLSQYNARAIAAQGKSQTDNQLLLGINDQDAAAQMKLNVIEWSGSGTDAFLAWVKGNVIKGYPVAIGIYTNEYLFYRNTDPTAGDKEYDHIVPVTGISSSHSLSDPTYYPDDEIYFSDNGLWGNSQNPPYNFNFPFSTFQANRKQANDPNRAAYSLSNQTDNYGIAITGVIGDTLPVRLATNFNCECPEIEDKSNTRPAPMPLILTITVSNLQPGIVYNLYRYNDFNSVPTADFNAHAADATAHWQFQITSGTTYVLTDMTESDTSAIYRAVRADAP
jgi:hypothetical protein